MLKELRPAVSLIVLFTIVLGGIFPVALSGIFTAIVPGPANGDLITRNGQPVGSVLIGQTFTSDRYFHPRPSALTGTDPKDPTKTVPTPYDASESGASNLAATSKALVDRVKGDVAALGGGPVPTDAVTASGSGLDPDISPANARGQVARVAKARNLPAEKVTALVETSIERPLAGVIGEPHINVLRLNLALDDLAKGADKSAAVK